MCDIMYADMNKLFHLLLKDRFVEPEQELMCYWRIGVAGVTILIMLPLLSHPVWQGTRSSLFRPGST